MDNYNEDQAYRGGSAGALTPDAQEAKRLRNQLVEYDGYLQEMRKSNMKNVETLDVIQRYTDKSAAGIQKLTEEVRRECRNWRRKAFTEYRSWRRNALQDCADILRTEAAACRRWRRMGVPGLPVWPGAGKKG